MAFRKVKGKTKNEWLPVTPSTAIAAGALVTFSSGKLVAAGAATAADDLAGVLVKAITALDEDYADDRKVAVQVPLQRNVVWEFTTSGLVATDIGVDVDLTDSVTVDRSATAIGVVRPTKRLSATKGQGFVKINGSY
jgi:hypothetical protein